MRAVEPDLSIYGPSIQIAKNKAGDPVVQVVVQNSGLEPSSERLLKIWRSPANDVVLDGTVSQKFFTVANDIAVPPLAAGERLTIEVPWSAEPKTESEPAQAIYTIGAQVYSPVNGAKEANEKNNSAVVHRSL